MKFVDRRKELTRLKNFIELPEVVLAVIYGRRRVGKSTLIKKAIEGKTAIYFQADETQVANQLSLLAKSIAMVIPGFDKVIYPDWHSILESINQRLPNNSILCLDEFPYLVKSYPALPSVIQNFIDNSNPVFRLILCGSSQQLMYSELLNEASPLYGRADLIMKIKPLTLGYISEAMELHSSQEAIDYYSVWGGIPRYWKMCMQYRNFQESFKQLLLEHEATLADEPNRLLRDDMRDLTLSRTLLSVIGDGANRMSEIAGKTNKPAQELTGSLKKLLDMGYIMKEVPFRENPKKSKKTLYKIKDPFLATYYKFVAPNASLISLDRPQVVWDIVENQITSYIGFNWESMCREAVSGNSIDGVIYSRCSRWWGNVPNKKERCNDVIEIDVMAESLDGQHLLIGECKWTNHENGQRILHELKEKSLKLPFIHEYPHVHFILFLKEKPVESPGCPTLFPEDVINLLK